MKIKFKRRRLNYQLLIGSFWILLGTFSHVYKLEQTLNIAYLILGIGYLSHYAYDFRFGYLNINDGLIHKNVLYSLKNKIKVDDITEIDRIDGYYLLKSEKDNLKIDPDLIEKESLKKLNEELVAFGLPPEKKLFYS